MGSWRRRRTERAVARLSDEIAVLRDEVAELDAQRGAVVADADEATTTAAVRPGGPTRREAERARSAHQRHVALLADRRDRLTRLQRQRDALLDQLVEQQPRRRRDP